MKTVRVVAAILHHESRILATQRGYGDFKDGWEFPGGKIEAGESPEAAIVRIGCRDRSRERSGYGGI